MKMENRNACVCVCVCVCVHLAYSSRMQSLDKIHLEKPALYTHTHTHTHTGREQPTELTRT